MEKPKLIDLAFEVRRGRPKDLLYAKSKNYRLAFDAGGL